MEMKKKLGKTKNEKPNSSQKNTCKSNRSLKKSNTSTNPTKNIGKFFVSNLRDKPTNQGKNAR